MSKKILVSRKEEGIFQLIINDAENENQLSTDLSVEFMTALDNLSKERELRVLILSGIKKVFCAGGSLQVLQKLAQGEVEVKSFYSVPNKLLNFPLPVIGALEGHAVGGGLILALCCDILVASENSRYGVNFTDLGFSPGMGTTTFLPALAGYHFSSEMMFTAKLYKGSELRDRGIFNYIVPSEEVLGRSLDIARRISEKPKHVLEMLKHTLSLPRRQALQVALSYEYLMHKLCFKRPETAAIIEANYFLSDAARSE